jgi:4a-hydroxytetrahydrobiopterin dehydratase
MSTNTETVDAGLARRKCGPCEGGTKPMDEAEIDNRLPLVPGWDCADGALVRTFTFKNFYETMAFVNAVAWIAHREDHHPNMVLGYKTCRVEYRTHSIGGLSENDFICAAKVSELQA